MNETKHPMELDSVIYAEPETKLNPFLVEKLKQLVIYISEPNHEGNFFTQIDDFSIAGSEVLKFIYLADVFGYGITVTKTDKLTIYFWKR
jgi:hypothetical protein